MPTDTIYGIVARALDKKTVERLYKIRRRSPKKPFIILISDISDLKKFGVLIDQITNQLINHLWPGKVSIILPCPFAEFKYLHRGTNTLAFRLPKKPDLIRLLKKTGPLVAPSANPEGLPPAKTIAQAEKYFSDKVDLYVSGRAGKKPSTLVAVKNGKIEILRK